MSVVVGGKEEIQPSRTENGRVSESERTKKAERHKWLRAFGFSASSRGVRRQTKRAGCCTFVEHAFHYTAFFLSPPPPASFSPFCQSLGSVGGNDLIMSVEPQRMWCRRPHAEPRSACRGRVCQDLVLPTSSDERSALLACFVFNEAVAEELPGRGLFGSRENLN